MAEHGQNKRENFEVKIGGNGNQAAISITQLNTKYNSVSKSFKGGESVELLNALNGSAQLQAE